MKQIPLTAIALIVATPVVSATSEGVLQTYSNIAAAKYEESLITAQRLRDAVNALSNTPSAEALQHARAAWLAARVPYQQTEVYRLLNVVEN